MAVIKKDNAFMEFPLQISRQYGAPIEKFEIFYAYEDAVEYATTNALAYVGQIIQVVDEANSNATAYIIKNTNGELEEIGASGASMLVVATYADLTTTVAADLKVGQTAYVTDEHKSYILSELGETPPSSYVWTEMTSSDVTWAGTENKITFYSMLQSAFDALEPKDNNTLYFVNDPSNADAGRIYKGNIDLTSSIIVTTTIPEAATAIKNKLYINSSTLEAKMTVNGVDWINLSPGYLTDSVNWAEADSNKFATIGLIKKGIQEALATINTNASFDNDTGTITVGSGTGAVLTGVAHDPNYVAETLTLTIPVYGGDDVVVNIPKDKFVTAGQYYEDYPDSETATHHNVIVLTIDNQAEPVIIPAEALVNIYTADNTGKNVSVTVTDDNKISANITIDPVAGNALTYSASGFKVDVSGKLNTYGAGNASEILISDAKGNVITRSGATVLLDPDNSAELGTSQTQIPVASVIARAIATAVNTAQTALQQQINGKLDKLTGTAIDAGKIAVVGADGTTISIGTLKIGDLATATSVANKVNKVVGTVNNFVSFAAEGAIQDSGIKAGGATINASPNANTLATEAAVAEMMSWQQIASS